MGHDIVEHEYTPGAVFSRDAMEIDGDTRWSALPKSHSCPIHTAKSTVMLLAPPATSAGFIRKPGALSLVHLVSGKKLGPLLKILIEFRRGKGIQIHAGFALNDPFVWK